MVTRCCNYWGGAGRKRNPRWQGWLHFRADRAALHHHLLCGHGPGLVRRAQRGIPQPHEGWLYFPLRKDGKTEGPAQQSGNIRPGDFITHINDVQVTGGVDHVSRLLQDAQNMPNTDSMVGPTARLIFHAPHDSSCPMNCDLDTSILAGDQAPWAPSLTNVDVQSTTSPPIFDMTDPSMPPLNVEKPDATTTPAAATPLPNKTKRQAKTSNATKTAKPPELPATRIGRKRKAPSHADDHL